MNITSTNNINPQESFYMNNKGEKVPLSNLQDIKVLCYYIGSKWCQVCSKFAPLLLDFYQQINKDSKQLEIVYLSCDCIETDYKDCIESFPWLSIGFNKIEIKKILEENNITSMPTVLVAKKDGTIVKKNGRADVQQLQGVKCFEEWTKLCQ